MVNTCHLCGVEVTTWNRFEIDGKYYCKKCFKEQSVRAKQAHDEASQSTDWDREIESGSRSAWSIAGAIFVFLGFFVMFLDSAGISSSQTIRLSSNFIGISLILMGIAFILLGLPKDMARYK
jgi:predicted phage tail protein